MTTAAQQTRFLFQLPLQGRARLEYKNREVKVRKKGLAILYYLAIEGPTRREQLADLLWDHADTAHTLQNLRVELHRLRASFLSLGYVIFQSGQRPLQPLDFVALQDEVSGADGMLEGLEDLSSQFQYWLEEQRLKRETVKTPIVEGEGLIGQLARYVKPPHVIILKGQIGSRCSAFAQALAQALRLPHVEVGRPGRKTVRTVCLPYPADALEQICSDQECVWVIERPLYGEDPRLLLELQSLLPPEQVSHLSLPPFTWQEARRDMLGAFSHDQAARLYLVTAGNATYLQELIALRSEYDGLTPVRGALPLPLRMRAIIQLETRFLSLDARIALERLAIHPGQLTNGLIEILEAKDHLDELERRGWLEFDEGWSFANESSRRILYNALQAGRRQRYHQLAAGHFAGMGEHLAAAYHAFAAGYEVDWNGVQASLGEAWAQESLSAWLNREPRAAPATAVQVGVGPELALLEKRLLGETGITLSESMLSLVRVQPNPRPNGVEWELPDEPCLLHLSGSTYLENILGVGLSGSAKPLELCFMGGPMSLRKVTFAHASTPLSVAPDELLLPLSDELGCWFYVPQTRVLRLQSAAEAAVLDLEVALYRPLPGHVGGAHTVDAFTFA